MTRESWLAQDHGADPTNGCAPWFASGTVTVTGTAGSCSTICIIYGHCVAGLHTLSPNFSIHTVHVGVVASPEALSGPMAANLKRTYLCVISHSGMVWHAVASKAVEGCICFVLEQPGTNQPLTCPGARLVNTQHTDRASKPQLMMQCPISFNSLVNQHTVHVAQALERPREQPQVCGVTPTQFAWQGPVHIAGQSAR